MKTPQEFYQESSLNIDERHEILTFTKLYAQYYHEQITKGNHGTTIISGFPGTGKTTYHNGDYQPEGWSFDSDSSQFDKRYFPNNYMKHIISKLGSAKYIFVSSHKEVRDALVENEIEFTLIYPNKNIKEEYISRYKKRGNNEGFVNLLKSNWDAWIKELEKQKGCKHIILQSNQFISNVI